MSAHQIVPDDVIRFWLGDVEKPGADPLAKAGTWYRKDEAFDREIEERFESTLERGVRGELAEWETTPRGRLALVLLYDQLSRNMFRFIEPVLGRPSTHAETEHLKSGSWF